MHSKIKYKQLVGYLRCYSTFEIIYRMAGGGGRVQFLSSSYLKLTIHRKIWYPMANITNNEISRI